MLITKVIPRVIYLKLVKLYYIDLLPRKQIYAIINLLISLLFSQIFRENGLNYLN